MYFVGMCGVAMNINASQVSCPKTNWHVEWGKLGLNYQPSGQKDDRLYLLSHSHPCTSYSLRVSPGEGLSEFQVVHPGQVATYTVY